MSDLIKIGGLWKNKDKNDNDYFSGGFTYGTKLLVMANTFKEKDNDVLRRRALGKFDTEWKKNQEEIKESLGDRDPNRITALFSKLRKQGSSSEKR